MPPAKRRGSPVKRLVASHRYTNKARIAIYRVGARKGLPTADVLLMQLTTSTGNVIGAYMRPDEAIRLATKLLDGVWRTVTGYQLDRFP